MRIENEDSYTGDDTLVYYEDIPFTGEVVTRSSEGTVIDLVTFVEGIPDGPQATWYPDGSRKSEGQTKWGRAVGDWRKWHANGRLAEEFVFNEDGRRVRRQRWDKDGNLTEDKAYTV